jgi:hypothetical protein
MFLGFSLVAGRFYGAAVPRAEVVPQGTALMFSIEFHGRYYEACEKSLPGSGVQVNGKTHPTRAMTRLGPGTALNSR